MTTEASMDTFRFLDLPKNIRLMVYEQLPIIRQHFSLNFPYTLTYSGFITLVLEMLPLAILRVSKMIHDEAYAMLKPKLYELLSRPPRLIIPAPDLFEIGHGFAKFHQTTRWILFKHGAKTLPAGKKLCYKPPQAYYLAKRSSLMLTPSLIRWTQHAALYFGTMSDHPILAQFAADNPCSPTRTAGVQLLIDLSAPGPLQYRACLHRRMPLRHTLSYFARENLFNELNQPTVDLFLIGISVPTTGLQRERHYYESQDLCRVICGAMFQAAIRGLQNQGDILELTAWRKGWQAGSGVGPRRSQWF